jgi:hypothetical protein
MDVSGQLHASAALTPRKELPGTHCIGGWVGSRRGLDTVEKREILYCLELKPVRPALSYTDWPVF